MPAAGAAGGLCASVLHPHTVTRFGPPKPDATQTHDDSADDFCAVSIRSADGSSLVWGCASCASLYLMRPKHSCDRMTLYDALLTRRECGLVGDDRRLDGGGCWGAFEGLHMPSASTVQLCESRCVRQANNNNVTGRG
jgi:hypothetical protein